MNVEEAERRVAVVTLTLNLGLETPPWGGAANSTQPTPPPPQRPQRQRHRPGRKTNVRQAVTPAERLTLTQRYLPTGVQAGWSSGL
ncbi:hypothetical protein O3P69_019598 [Scylla paramamosain]|uniref:Uncharacterized protein n=1 Tax=Scylla paramamosain TaxID=85552 RepID=A0AAW0SY97_SCYPA